MGTDQAPPLVYGSPGSQEQTSTDAEKAAAFDLLLDQWYQFSHQCAANNRTDTDEVWELMAPVLDRWRPGHSDVAKALF